MMAGLRALALAVFITGVALLVIFALSPLLVIGLALSAR